MSEAAIWSVFLVAALLFTAIDAALLARVVRLAGQVRALGRYAVPAAEGIARHLADRSIERSARAAAAVARSAAELETAARRSAL